MQQFIELPSKAQNEPSHNMVKCNLIQNNIAKTIQ